MALLPGTIWDRIKIKSHYIWKKFRPERVFIKWPEAKNKIPKYVLGIFILLMMALIFQRNLAKWKKESYLKNVLKNFPVLSEVADLRPPNFGVSGVFGR